MKRCIALGVVPTLMVGLALGAGVANGAPTAHKKAPVKKAQAQPGTLGTKQMAGGDGHFGQTYTLTDGGDPLNYTITSAEYALGRVNFADSGTDAVNSDEKFFIIHYRIKNPNKQDSAYSSNGTSCLFQTVDADNATAKESGNDRRENERKLVDVTLKPGQGIDDLVAYAKVSAKGPLSKMILQLRRVGTHDEVTRFPLGVGANIVKPIPAPYADPADPTGATPLAVVPAAIGTKYVTGYFDFTLDSVAYAPGPFGDTTADDGKQFVVATLTFTNKTWQARSFDTSTAVGKLVTDDGEKTTSDTMLNAKSDDGFDGDQLDPDDSITVRMLFQIPKDAKAKSLELRENVGSGDGTQSFRYDLSSLN